MSSSSAHNAIRFSPAARAVVVALLLIFLLWYLLPMWVLLTNSLKSADEIRAGNLIAAPAAITFAPWIKAWSGACTGVDCRGLQPFFWNSIFMVVPAVLISTFLGAVNGYVLSHWKFRGSDLVFAGLLLGCFIPFQAVILPMARTLGMLGLANTTAGLILAHVVYGIAFTTLFFRNYYVSIPVDLITAARMDGAGFFTIFWRIMLPLSTPIIMVTIIWQFTQVWNDFLFGIAFANGGSAPITVALNNLVNTSTGVKEYNVDMAAAIIAGLPTLLVYIFAGKYFVRGLTAGAVKG